MSRPSSLRSRLRRKRDYPLSIGQRGPDRKVRAFLLQGPIMDLDFTVVCEAPDCDVRFLQRSAQKRFCSPRCQDRTWNASQARTRGQKRKLYNRKYGRTRRAKKPNLQDYEAAGRQARQYANMIYRREGGRCYYCKTKLIFENRRSWNIEHMIPWERGGKSEPENLTLSCRSCNKRKGNLTAEEFLKEPSRESET